jgi:hypothetical protein
LGSIAAGSPGGGATARRALVARFALPDELRPRCSPVLLFLLYALLLELASVKTSLGCGTNWL